VLIAGDQYQGNAEAHWNYVYKNVFEIDDYQRSAELYRRLAPELILTGHWEPYWVEPEYLAKLERRGQTLARLHRELLPQGAGFGMSIRPYQTLVTAGEPFALEVAVKSPWPDPKTATVRLLVPEGWSVEPPSRSLELPAHGTVTLPFEIVPSRAGVRRARLAADLTVGAVRFGQGAEALVTVRGEA
jgi:hypothetical protein